MERQLRISQHVENYAQNVGSPGRGEGFGGKKVLSRSVSVKTVKNVGSSFRRPTGGRRTRWGELCAMMWPRIRYARMSWLMRILPDAPVSIGRKIFRAVAGVGGLKMLWMKEGVSSADTRPGRRRCRVNRNTPATRKRQTQPRSRR